VTLGAIREALADALSVIPGVQVSPYVLAQPTPPGIQIPPPGATYHTTMRAGGDGINEWEFIIQGFVSLNSDVGAQRVLDELCATSGPKSVSALLEADLTLGGVVETLIVTSQTGGRQVEQPPGNPMLLVEWHVTVYAKGT
jgi:hypothetical protein